MTADDDLLWLHAREEVTLVELVRCSGLPEALVRELVEYEVLAPLDRSAPEWRFSARYVLTVRTAARLREDLELDTATLAMALALLDRIEGLESEVRRLRAVRKD